MSKYKDIYEDLAGKIKDNMIPPGTYLPSENDLMVLYSASRDTVRKALNLMQERGMILKERGKGSKALGADSSLNPFSEIVSYKEQACRRGFEPYTRVLECQKILDERGQKALNLDQDQEVMRIVRLRHDRNKELFLEEDFLNPDFVPQMTEQIAEESILEYLEKELDLTVSHARRELRVEAAGSEEAGLLGLSPQDPVVVIRSYTYLKDSVLFHAGRSVHPADRFRFSQIARRISK